MACLRYLEADWDAERENLKARAEAAEARIERVRALLERQLALDPHYTYSRVERWIFGILDEEKTPMTMTEAERAAAIEALAKRLADNVLDSIGRPLPYFDDAWLAIARRLFAAEEAARELWEALEFFCKTTVMSYHPEDECNCGPCLMVRKHRDRYGPPAAQTADKPAEKPCKGCEGKGVVGAPNFVCDPDPDNVVPCHFCGGTGIASQHLQAARELWLHLAPLEAQHAVVAASTCFPEPCRCPLCKAVRKHRDRYGQPATQTADNPAEKACSSDANPSVKQHFTRHLGEGEPGELLLTEGPVGILNIMVHEGVRPPGFRFALCLSAEMARELVSAVEEWLGRNPPCETCRGTGKVRRLLISGDPDIRDCPDCGEKPPCKTCRGTGRVRVASNHPEYYGPEYLSCPACKQNGEEHEQGTG